MGKEELEQIIVISKLYNSLKDRGLRLNFLQNKYNNVLNSQNSIAITGTVQTGAGTTKIHSVQARMIFNIVKKLQPATRTSVQFLIRFAG